MTAAAPIGVVAGSVKEADALIRALGLTNARALPRRSDSIEGMRLSAAIIAESAYPLPDHFAHTLHCNVLKTSGQPGVYELRRVGDRP